MKQMSNSIVIQVARIIGKNAENLAGGLLTITMILCFFSGLKLKKRKETKILLKEATRLFDNMVREYGISQLDISNFEGYSDHYFIQKNLQHIREKIDNKEVSKLRGADKEKFIHIIKYLLRKNRKTLQSSIYKDIKSDFAYRISLREEAIKQKLVDNNIFSKIGLWLFDLSKDLSLKLHISNSLLELEKEEKLGKKQAINSANVVLPQININEIFGKETEERLSNIKLQLLNKVSSKTLFNNLMLYKILAKNNRTPQTFWWTLDRKKIKSYFALSLFAVASIGVGFFFKEFLLNKDRALKFIINNLSNIAGVFSGIALFATGKKITKFMENSNNKEKIGILKEKKAKSIVDIRKKMKPYFAHIEYIAHMWKKKDGWEFCPVTFNGEVLYYIREHIKSLDIPDFKGNDRKKILDSLDELELIIGEETCIRLLEKDFVQENKILAKAKEANLVDDSFIAKVKIFIFGLSKDIEVKAKLLLKSDLIIKEINKSVGKGFKNTLTDANEKRSCYERRTQQLKEIIKNNSLEDEYIRARISNFVAALNYVISKDKKEKTSFKLAEVPKILAPIVGMCVAGFAIKKGVDLLIKNKA